LNDRLIRKMETPDIDEVVDIWYEASIVAHNFIPKDFWDANRAVMKSKYMPMSEAYVFIDGEQILGFIALIDEYLAAIFVKPESQGKGIGSSLLSHIKNLRDHLQLKVYDKNKKSINFYRNKGFSVISESFDSDTGEHELIMEWIK